MTAREALQREDGVLLQTYGSGNEVRGYWQTDDGGGRWMRFVEWFCYDNEWTARPTDTLSRKALGALRAVIAAEDGGDK